MKDAFFSHPYIFIHLASERDVAKRHSHFDPWSEMVTRVSMHHLFPSDHLTI